MAKNNYYETRGTLNHLLDYTFVFNEQRTLADAALLIEGIPSMSLLLYIGGINLSLYLSDWGEVGQQKQNDLIKSFTTPHSEILKKIIAAYEKIVRDSMWPTVFYRYSNLLFYELIFLNFNHLPVRELTVLETENILKTYLIINGEVNSRIKIEDQEAADAFDSNSIEQVILPNFIYQNDYRSNVDFSNQFTRAVRFFEYLDSHDKYGVHMPTFYQNQKALSANELVYRIAEIFTLMQNVGKGDKQLIISTADDPSKPHNQLLMNVAIDLTTFRYKKDDSFRQFRNKMFVFTPNKKFLLLDIGFLVDYLYKTQVFALSDFFKKKGLNNFLGDKAVEFMEQVYLREVMTRCFPIAKKYFGKELIKKNKDELTDCIVMVSGRMLMIEFKDTILNSKSKNSGQKDAMFDALNMKFLEDDGPKGITQLENAIKYLDETYGNQFDISFPDTDTIYPVIIYTDNVFGFDGINKIYKRKFKNLLPDKSVINFQIHDVTFINLSFFEINEDYLKQNELDIFELIEHYHQHTSHSSFSITPFEVFARAYIDETVKRQRESTSFFKEMTAKTIEKFSEELANRIAT